MRYHGLITNLFVWWYSKGIEDLFGFLYNLFIYIYKTFSINTLFKTIFSPWKRMVHERGRGIDGLKDWLVDEIISRGVGFVVRIIVFLTFIVFLIFYGGFAFIATVFWFLMPAVVLGSGFIIVFIGG